MELSHELEANLRELASAGPVELREKATESLNLTLQAAAYWLRIKGHLDHGDIAR